MTLLRFSRWDGASVEERFWSKVDPCRTDGCALFLGSTSKGYGQFYNGSRVIKAHKFIVGPAPVGLVWDHVKARGCTHRNCVWPEHLELVTPRENTARGDNFTAIQARRTHCIHGHEFTLLNTYQWRGQRKCRACLRLRDRIRGTQRQRVRRARLRQAVTS